MRRSLTANIAANVIGRMYTAIVGVLLVPVYLHFLGVEAYGLFALLNSYMAIAGLLDLGFSAAITREVAKLSAVSPGDMRDLIWTISIPYCTAALLIALGIYFGSPWIAFLAIKSTSSFQDPTIVHAVGLAGFGLTLQLPIFLFAGGLAGIERQDLANGITIGATTLRHGVAVILLWRFSNSVATLMASQAIVAALTAVGNFIFLWWQMPANNRRPRFRPKLFGDVWRFAVSVGGITILGTIVLQSDKVIVGALLPLKEVGHYMVASVIGSNLLLISQPVAVVAFPRFSQLVVIRDWATSSSTFRNLSQLVALMLLPLTTTIAFFPAQTLLVWTGNVTVAESAAPVLRLLAIGVSFSACACIPYGLIVAAGRTRAFLIFGVIGCAIALPLVYFSTAHFGIIGAAAAMCVYFGVGFAFCAAVLCSLVGRREWSRWISTDVALPQALVVAVALFVLALAPRTLDRTELLALLSVTWLASAFAAGLAMPSMREHGLWHLQHIRQRWS
jgi:O-antigen/teichoic acid export membrane protein